MEDPWSPVVAISRNNPSDTSTISFEFEDNFTPTVGDTLPDSEQYLAGLERKLQRIRNDPNFLKQLQERREACMQQLLAGEKEYLDEYTLELEEPINSNQIISRILPEQPLTVGEVAELIRYDYLVNEETEETASR